MAKRAADKVEETPDQASGEPSAEPPGDQVVAPVAGPAPTVQFRNGVSWAGDNFSYIAGDVIELPEEVARAREVAGMGTIVETR